MGFEGFHRGKAGLSQGKLQAGFGWVWQSDLDATRGKPMTQITDIGLLKHHRVDYGPQVGEPTHRAGKGIGSGIFAVAMIALTLNVFFGLTA